MKNLMQAFVDACPVQQTGLRHDGKELLGYYRDDIEDFLKRKFVINRTDLTRVFSGLDGAWTTKAPDSEGYIQGMKPKKQAFLITSSIEPVERPTAEDILGELVRQGDQVGASWPNEVCDLYKKAKNMLDKNQE